MPKSQWQERLRLSQMDESSVKHIIGAENEIGNLYDAFGGEFAQYLTNMYIKGDFGKEDIISAMKSFMGKMNERIKISFSDYLRKLDGSARHNAIKKLPIKKEGIVKVAAVWNENLGRTLNRVVTMPEDVVESIRDKFAGLSVFNAHDIVRSLISEKERSIMGDERLTPQQMKKALRGVWGRYKYNLERIVRTESMGAFTRSTLQAWYDMGIREVERVPINDNKTCEICKEVGRPGNRWLIKDLLEKCDNPLIEDPYYKNEQGEFERGHFLTHPQCRCAYKIVYNTTKAELLYYELTGHDPDFKAVNEVKLKNCVVKEVPVEYEESIRNILKALPEPDVTAEFVNDITNSEKWRMAKSLQYKEMGYSDDEIVEVLKTEIKRKHGQILEYFTKKKEIVLGIRNLLYSSPVHILARIDAYSKWAQMTQAQKNWVKGEYDRKKMELGYTLKDQGIQVYGGLNFPSHLAQESSEMYFAECYGYYTSNPVYLRSVDNNMYDWLKRNIFGNKEWYARGGIK